MRAKDYVLMKKLASSKQTSIAWNRQSMKIRMAHSWLKKHRPDVWRAILEEIESKYPHKKVFEPHVDTDISMLPK